MIRFEPKSREEMGRLHNVWKYVHGFLLIYSHQAMDLDLEDMTHISGIFKYEGGININHKEIVLYRDAVRDDWTDSLDPTPEEQAVVDGVTKFFGKLDLTDENTIEDTMTKMYEELTEKEQKLFSEFCANPFSGDPLHTFLNLR